MNYSNKRPRKYMNGRYPSIVRNCLLGKKNFCTPACFSYKKYTVSIQTPTTFNNEFKPVFLLRKILFNLNTQVLHKLISVFFFFFYRKQEKFHIKSKAVFPRQSFKDFLFV